MLNLTPSAIRVSAARLVLGAAIALVVSGPAADREALAAAEVEPMHATAPVAVVEAVAPVELSAYDVAAWPAEVLGAVNQDVFALALRAVSTAVNRGDVAEPATLTVIDFSRRSTDKRMWVYDLRSRTLLYEEVVSHGRGSGMAVATRFSNQPESNTSSLGLYRTAETYIGKHGYSLRLDGLDAGYNDRARERAIVMHAADYVNPVAAASNGYLGRSLGCPALRPAISRDLIDAVKGGGLLFAYYPDPQWLASSTYLN